MAFVGISRINHLTYFWNRPLPPRLRIVLAKKMDTSFIYRLMESGEESIVCELSRRVFNQFVAPLYAKEGIEEFHRISTPEALRFVSDYSGHIVYVALNNQEIVGVIKTKNVNHISWLFVDSKHQTKGIGKNLIRTAVNHCLRISPEIQEITVNSSPNSYSAYQRFGFFTTGSETEGNGIIFTPMTLRIPDFIS